MIVLNNKNIFCMTQVEGVVDCVSKPNMFLHSYDSSVGPDGVCVLLSHLMKIVQVLVIIIYHLTTN